jgi:hypothetical protein
MNRRNVLKMMAASLLSGCIPRKKEERYIVEHVVLNSENRSHFTNRHHVRLSKGGEWCDIIPLEQHVDGFFRFTAIPLSEKANLKNVDEIAKSLLKMGCRDDKIRMLSVTNSDNGFSNIYAFTI